MAPRRFAALRFAGPANGPGLTSRLGQGLAAARFVRPTRILLAPCCSHGAAPCTRRPRPGAKTFAGPWECRGRALWCIPRAARTLVRCRTAVAPRPQPCRAVRQIKFSADPSPAHRCVMLPAPHRRACPTGDADASYSLSTSAWSRSRLFRFPSSFSPFLSRSRFSLSLLRRSTAWLLLPASTSH